MSEKPKVLYNGACPICRREIDHYRRLDDDHASALDFADISEPSPDMTALALDGDQARRRLHVLDADGHLLVGVPAFAAIWDRLPRYRWLAYISRLPILRWLLPWIYEPIAFGLYHWDKRRRRRQCSVDA
jgi:predicted DCC family thiol-disulfide oxidoreductase YuxK